MLQFENIFKSIFTTLIGCALMGCGVYGWYTEWLTGQQALVAITVGFALLWMRDKLPDFIGKLFNGLLEKFFGKKTAEVKKEEPEPVDK